MQSMSQQGGGGSSCVELGQYGKEEEVERLRRDRDVLMAEVLKLKQQHHSSKERLKAIEGRLRGSEKKQQQITSFVAKAFSNPLFVKQLSNEQNRVEIGQKRRLTMNTTMDKEHQLVGFDAEMESLISAAVDDEASSVENDLFVEAALFAGDTSSNPITDDMLEKLRSEDEAKEDLASDQSEGTPYWSEELQELVDELGL